MSARAVLAARIGDALVTQLALPPEPAPATVNAVKYLKPYDGYELNLRQ